jgi:hypothetical protein
LEPSILFNGSLAHDDQDYLAWLDAHPDGFVANIPHPHTPYDHFPVVLHRASCPEARNRGNGGRLTSNTQWKVCDLSLDVVKQGALRYTRVALKYCQSNRNGGCGRFWTAEGNTR